LEGPPPCARTGFTASRALTAYDPQSRRMGDRKLALHRLRLRHRPPGCTIERSWSACSRRWGTPISPSSNASTSGPRSTRYALPCGSRPVWRRGAAASASPAWSGGSAEAEGLSAHRPVQRPAGHAAAAGTPQVPGARHPHEGVHLLLPGERRGSATATADPRRLPTRPYRLYPIEPNQPETPVEDYFDSETRRNCWLIKRLMSTVGLGLLSGQWGTGKTFQALRSRMAYCSALLSRLCRT
jgi:hypothetical protein